ncbi:cytochrome P450 [Streptomyces nigrescens]|uniref:Cytochrome P450 n=1 Tax=Streptomyces nigrescens TaxID=1920 RepID=A0ABN6QUP9_STRNI|nr:hypothetical protein [Streptomyces nigrescens]BDM68351.1 cytochrome P450 [Streptomyces nigrescens]
MNRAGLHELRVLAASRPALPLLLHAGRLARPLTYVPKLGWLTADAATARSVLVDQKHFTVLDRGGVGRLWAQLLGGWVEDLFDGEGHRALRAGTRELFGETAARELVDRTIGARLVEARVQLAAGRPLDVAALGRAVVGRIVTELLRVPVTGTDDAAYERVFATARALAALSVEAAGGGELTEATVARGRGIVARLTGHVEGLWATEPADHLIGRCREVGLNARQTAGMAALVGVAATETAASAITRTVALLHDTGEQHALLASPQRVPEAVREGLRVTAPAPVIGRTVRSQVRLAGRTLRAGDRITLLNYTANSLTGGFRLGRPAEPANRQLWFGAGRHHCLGSAIAQAEIGRTLETLTAVGRPWRITERRYSRRVVIPSYDRLTVTLV